MANDLESSWVHPVTHHPDSDAAKAPGGPQAASPPSYGRQVALCLGGALAGAWDALGDDAKASIQSGAVRAGKAGLWHLRATAPVWAPKGAMLARMVLTVACEAIEGLERREPR